MTSKNQSLIGTLIIIVFKPSKKPLKNKIMKKFSLLSLSVFALLTLTSCDAIGTIFKAGMWWGFILVAGVIGLVIWLFTRGKGGE